MALFDENVTDHAAAAATAVARDASRGCGRWPSRWSCCSPSPSCPTVVRHPAARTGVQHARDGRRAPTATQVPLISVEGAETFPTDGALDLLTVQVAGNRERTPSWFELARAWFDPSKAVLPIDAVFPEGQTTEERNEESAAMMVDSQNEATAAALTELGYDVERADLGPLAHRGLRGRGHPRGGRRHPRGRRRAGDGCRVPARHRERRRRRARSRCSSSATASEQTVVGHARSRSRSTARRPWLIGVTLITDYDFPIDVTIQLNNVGGPSAGMMFALGIMDALTPGELNGGENVAGTGTITADGTVGPIGGIRQKMWGARRRRRRLVPRARVELRRGRRARPRGPARVLGRDPRRLARRARRDPRGRRPRRAADLHALRLNAVR